jgi:hypothetical protein
MELRAMSLGGGDGQGSLLQLNFRLSILEVVALFDLPSGLIHSVHQFLPIEITDDIK